MSLPEITDTKISFVESPVYPFRRFWTSYNLGCLKNRLILHEGKTDALIFDTNIFIGPLKPLIWGDKIVQFSSSSICLGVTIDNQLSWSKHLEYIQQGQI